jgi:hypothetical protein
VLRGSLGAPAALALALGLAGCFSPPNLTEKLADAAIDMNQATRFGRMDVALEHIGATARDDFARHHQDWGRGTRIVDVELAGMNVVEKDEANVFLTVSWQRADEGDLRVTYVTQRWKNAKGSWLMQDERRKGGDIGLFGEPMPIPPPSDGHAQFPTRVIRGD